MSTRAFTTPSTASSVAYTIDLSFPGASVDPWRASRVLALLNFALADSGMAALEAKYHFRFWRPYTAIRRAGEDGNDRTEADPGWLPLLWTAPDKPPTFFIPPFPDYPSLAAVSAAATAAEVAARRRDHGPLGTVRSTGGNRLPAGRPRPDL